MKRSPLPLGWLILEVGISALVRLNKLDNFVVRHHSKGRHQLKKKHFLSGIARIMGGGGLPMPEFFGPLFRSAFLVNKKSLYLQKCQCIEHLTVF